MKVKIVYFAYLIPDKWNTIVEEQLSSLKNTHLYEEASNIYMSVISDDDELEKLKIFLSNKYSKVEIKNHFKENLYEYPGLKTIYQIAEDDDDTVLLYFHSKGMTSNQHETRQYLFKYTIENYADYLKEFKYNKYLEVAGAIPHENGFIFFNFFWARSSYVRNHCSRPEISDNRYIWEVWVGSEFSRKKEIITYSPIIKYDTVKHHHEVWHIHDKMIKNHYCHLLNNVIIEDVVIEDQSCEESKSQQTVKPDPPKPVCVQATNPPKPVRIDPANPNIPSKPVLIQATNTPKPVRIDPPKPVRIDPAIPPKPVRIDPANANIPPKPVLLETVKVEPPKPVLTTKQEAPTQVKSIQTVVEEEKANKKVSFEMDTELYNIKDLNPYTVFERLKNKDHIVVELGAHVGLNTYMLSKRFKKVVVVEHDKTNLERLESNIRNYCHKNININKKRLVQIKSDLKADITTKELLYNNIHKYFQKVNLIVCDMKDYTNDIIEDIFHYAFHSKINILIKFYNDVKEYNYLFDYFNHNNIVNNNWLFFEPRSDKIQLVKKNMSIVIIGFNQYTYISKMVKQLEPFSKDIIIIDNKSDYKPLLNYYDTEYKYSLLKMDKNHGHKVYETAFIISLLGNMYIITDPDLKFNEKLPRNCIEEMVKISNDYKAGRVGFALLIDTDDIRPGLSYAGMPLKQWEGRFWVNKVQHPKLELYSAPIDTTFCLLNTIHNINGLSIRVAGDYVCKHLPWHENYYLELLDDEYDHYLLNNKSTNFWIDKNKKDKPSSIHRIEETKNGVQHIEENKSDITSTRILIEIDSDDEIDIDTWIINKVKNPKNIAINIGSSNIDNLSKNFKFVVNIANYVVSLGDNILNYSDKIVNVKKNSNEITWKQFIYDNTIYKQEIKLNISFISINYDGNEESILEDLLHYSWNVKSNIYIHFNLNNWKDKNIDRFSYLFEFFEMYVDNKLITNINSTIENNVVKVLFMPNKNLSKDMFKKNMTCVIIGFNQQTYIKKMVKQLENYTNDIVIIDNNSTFEPLIKYYENNYQYTLLRMKSNLGHKVYEKPFMDKIVGDIYILTDPDLEFNKKLPHDFIENMINISNYYQAEKVGFALLYLAPDIRPDIKAFGKTIKEWEKQYWTYKYYYPGFEHDIWSAAIDTTFCLINKQNKGGHYRIAGDYLCKHLPWHIGFEKEIPNDEFEYYMRNNVSTNYWKK